MWGVAVFCQQFSYLSWKDEEEVSNRNIWDWLEPKHPSLHAVCLLYPLYSSRSVDDMVVAMWRYTCAVNFGKAVHDPESINSIIWHQIQNEQIIWPLMHSDIIVVFKSSEQSKSTSSGLSQWNPLVGVMSIGTKMLWFAFPFCFLVLLECINGLGA